jgi:TPR repeat protein
MTTLAYMRAPVLSPEDAAVAAKIGAALASKRSDPERSNQDLREIANAGEYGAAHAHIELSNRYARGDSVPRDTAKALEHMTAAVEFGDTAAMCLLAFEYTREPHPADEFLGGQYVATDLQEALRLYRRAAALGDVQAQTSLADLLRAGRFAKDCSAEEVDEITRNYESAGEWAYLGGFFCENTSAPGFPKVHVEEALRCYRRGREADIEWCTRKLQEWEDAQSSEHNSTLMLDSHPALSVSAVRPPVASNSPRKWTLMGVLLTPVALVLWAIIGTTVLGFLVFVQSVTGPVFLGLAVLYGAFRALSRKKK